MNERPSFTDQLLERIKERDVHMKSRVRLVWERVRHLLPFALLVAATVLFGSFYLYFLRATGAASIAGLGWWRFVRSLPVAMTVVFLALLAVAFVAATTVHAFRRTALLWTFGGVLLGVLVGGAAVTWTPLHASLQNIAERDELPLIGDLYRDIHGYELHGAVVGTVTKVSGKKVTVETPRGPVTVRLRNGTRLRGIDSVEKGQDVVVIGEWSSRGDFEADLVQRAPSAFPPRNLLHGRQFPFRIEGVVFPGA